MPTTGIRYTVPPGDISLLFDDSAVMALDEPGDHIDFKYPEVSHPSDPMRQCKWVEERCKEIDAIL
jgi:hypothetical protein